MPVPPRPAPGAPVHAADAACRPIDDVDELAVTTLRFLAVDAVQAARSGHPGLPLGAAPIGWMLWSRHLAHDPDAPGWPDRDRFVLSAGHGSMLLYGLLHVFGYDLPAAQLARFRSLGSATPGHPEVGHTPGVETTTGPLGQGLATAVGMALAERMLAARCNTAGHRVVGHRTWVLAGDGDLMEGISQEAVSLAGRLRLGKLVVIYDDNDVTIDGPAHRSCADDAAMRFAASGWRTLWVDDGNDLAAIDRALGEARAIDDRPTLITVRTTIGYGAGAVQGTPAAHGSPLGDEAIAAMRERWGWPSETFHVPEQVARVARRHAEAGARAHRAWTRRHDRWRATFPDVAAAFPLDRVPAAPQDAVAAELADDRPRGGAMATRKASGEVLAALAQRYPALVGGSADLAASTNTALPGGDVGDDDHAGRTIHFGIREHGMAAALNGIALHGGLRPFGSTFLVFADYLRPALRLSALMRLPVIYVFTHDSVHVGEDGPTHQPIEQIESLRLIPGVTVLRPADAAETALAWEIATTTLDGPTVLVLSRQDLPVLGGAGLDRARAHGARVVRDEPEGPDVVLAASGSEVGLALVAAELLDDRRGVRAQVVSVLCRERFDLARRSGEVAVPSAPVVWVEAGVSTGWRALAGPQDVVIGIDRFGASGPGAEVAEHLGLSAARVADAALGALGRRAGNA